MKTRVWLFLSFLVLAVLGVAWVRWGVPRVEARLHGKIQSVLARRLRRPVRIDRVRLNPLFLAVSLENLRVAAGPGPDAPDLFACRRWTLFLTPIHRARTFPWFALSFGKSRVEVPVLNLDALPAGGASHGFTSFSLLPAHRLEWAGGSFHVPSFKRVPPFTLADAAGTAVLSATDVSLELHGRTPWGPADLAGRAGEPVFLSRRKGARWKAVLVLPEADLEALSALAPDPGALPGAWKGTAEVSLTMEGRLRPAAVSHWAVSAAFKDAAWTIDQRPCPVGGRISFSPEKAAFDDFSLAGGLILNGTVSSPTEKKASCDLSLKADGFPLEELRGRLPWKALSALPWRGTAGLTASLKGPLRRPEVKAAFSAEQAGAGPLVLPAVKAALSSSEEGLTLEASLAGGTLRAASARPATGAGLDGEWGIHLEGIRLEDLARAGGWGKVGGLLGGDFALHRSTATAEPIAGGVLRLDRPAWGDHRMDETVISYFSWRDGTARFHNKADTFDVVVRRADGGWKFDRVSYVRADGSSVQGAGAAGGPGGAVSFKGAVRQASLRDLPFLLERYPELEGLWEADLDVGGTLSDPSVDVSFRGGGARLRRDAPLHDFRGRLRWRGNAFSLDELKLDEAWSAAAVRSSDGQWQAGVTAKGADAGLFREVFLSSAPLSGAFDGRLALTGSGAAGWQGTVDASAPALRWGGDSFPSARVKADWRKDAVRLESLGAGTRAYAGEALRLPNGSWSFSADGPFIGHAAGEARVEEGRLSVKEVSFGDGLSGEGRVLFAGKTLEGRLAVKDFPAEALGRRFGAAWAAEAGGKLNGTVLLHGPLSAPEADADLRWTSAQWGGTPWEGASLARWKDGALFIDEGRVESGGGAAVFRGRLPRDGSLPLLFSLRADGLPLAPAGFSAGVLKGDVVLEGPRGAVAGSVSLQAEGVAMGGLPPFGARLEAAYGGGLLKVKSGEAATRDGRWRLRPGGTVAFLDGGVDFQIGNDLRNVQAGPASLFGGLVLAGSWRAAPPARLSVTLTAEDLWVNEHSFDRELARVTWSEGRLAFEPPPGAFQRLTGAVDFTARPQVRFQDVSLWEGAERRLRVDGEAGPGPWRFSLEGHGLEAETLLSLADLDVTGEGLVDVLLTGRGDGGAPQVEAEVLGKNGSVEGVPYDDLAATVLWERGKTELRSLKASRRRGYALSGQGQVEAAADPDAPARMNLKFRLTDGNLAILKDLWPACRQAKGSFEGDLTMAPGPRGPVASGYFSLSDGSFRAGKYLREVSDLTVGLRLRDNRILFDEFSARSGRGRFVVTGDVGVQGFRVKDYNLSVRTLGKRGVPVEVPQLSVPPGPLLTRFSILRRTLQADSKGQPRLDVTIKGPHGSHVIAGEVVLDETHFTYPPAKDAFKGMSRGSWWYEFWEDAVWDISLKTGRDTWYQNEYVNTHVNGRVSIQGPKESLRLDGKVSSDQGMLNYLSQSFQVRKALFEVFTDTRAGVSDGSTLAYLSGEAERSATTIDNRGVASLDVITMIIPRAPLGEIKPRFVSRNNPGLSSERVFQKMLGFSSVDPLQSPSPEEQDQLLRAGLVQLVGSSAAPFANRLAQLFGIDMISAIYDPAAPAGDARLTETGASRLSAENGTNRSALARWQDLLRGTGASAGVRLTDRLFGVYKFKVDQTTRNQVYLRDEVQVVGRVLGSLYVTFSSELDGRSFLGQPPNRQAMLEQQWRFGLPRPKAKKTQEEK